MNNKRIKIYLVVIGVGALALIVDRMRSRSTPQRAAADLVVPAPEPAVAPVDWGPQVVVRPFPREIPHAVIQLSGRDPFKLTEQVRAHLLPPEPVAAEAPEQIAPPPAPLSDRFELGAIIRVGRSRRAIVDELSLTVGQTLEDCTLTEISDRSVTFSCGDREERLSLAEPQGVRLRRTSEKRSK
jgi:hypothetical protein